MYKKSFPMIDLVATGNNIRRLRLERGLTVRDLQSYFGFEEPRAIYKWQKGESLPTVDNLYALGNPFEVPMDQILVPVAVKLHIVGEQQAESCCSSFFYDRLFWIRQESDATSTICSVCIVGCMKNHTFDAAHGERSVFDQINLITSELGLHASKWRCQFESKNESSDERTVLM